MNQSIKSLLTTLLFFLTATLLISCDKNNSNSDCDNIACTEEFRTIVITIKDQNQNPFALDSYEVINIDNNEYMTVTLSASEFERAQQLGEYPLLDDGSLEINQEREVQFKGFVNNQELIQSTYTVSTDCCHINLDSGTVDFTL